MGGVSAPQGSAFDTPGTRRLDRQRRNAHAVNLRPNLELYRNASLIELGVSDPSKMRVETLR